MSENTSHAANTLFEGNFGGDRGSLKFILSDTLPDTRLVTSVIAVLRYQHQFILVEHKDRGVDFPGGHVEPGETPDTAMRREIQEETGGSVRDMRLFGYLVLSPAAPIARTDRAGEFYPFPHSYLPFYLCHLDTLADADIGDTDILSLKRVDAAQARQLLNQRDPHFGQIIDYVFDTFGND